jgi:hypothetical protein
LDSIRFFFCDCQAAWSSLVGFITHFVIGFILFFIFFSIFIKKRLEFGVKKAASLSSFFLLLIIIFVIIKVEISTTTRFPIVRLVVRLRHPRFRLNDRRTCRQAS